MEAGEKRNESTHRLPPCRECTASGRFCHQSPPHIASPCQRRLCLAHIATANIIPACRRRTTMAPRRTHRRRDIGPVAYHDFEHATAGEHVCQQLVKDLGATSKVMLLRNHGCITVGKTVNDAFFSLMELIEACKVQVRFPSVSCKAQCRRLCARCPAAKQFRTESKADSREKGGFGATDVGPRSTLAIALASEHSAACYRQVLSMGMLQPDAPLHKVPEDTVKATYKITQANYTGKPFGMLEWQAACRQMERLYGKAYKE